MSWPGRVGLARVETRQAAGQAAGSQQVPSTVPKRKLRKAQAPETLMIGPGPGGQWSDNQLACAKRCADPLQIR